MYYTLSLEWGLFRHNTRNTIQGIHGDLSIDIARGTMNMTITSPVIGESGQGSEDMIC